MDNFVIAVSRFRRRKYDDSIALCDLILKDNPLDQSAWVLKCTSLTKKFYLDDIEIDEEGIGDILMDDNSTQTNSLARPGTSFQRPNTQSGQGIRPMSKQGRLQTGFARPVTQRQGNQENVLKTARVGTRMGTARPMTSGGRYVRLGTASLQQMGEQFIQVDKLDLKKLAQKPVISRFLCDYLLYVEHNPNKALQLAAEATQVKQFDDWWWKERLGKAYFMMGLYRDADRQFQSSIKSSPMIKTELQLIKLDQPCTAIEMYKRCIDKYPNEISFLIGMARVYDQLNEPKKAIDFYSLALIKDNSNIECVASLGSFHFYQDQPEVGLQLYKRLIQLGIYTSEIWNNLGLCCFYSGQYDLFYPCFERALSTAQDNQTRAEIWYNMSHVFINLGDIGTAYKCLKLSICLDPNHGESLNNLGVLQNKRMEFEKAAMNYQNAIDANEHLYEPVYNKAVLLYNQQEFAQCYTLVNKALQLFPAHFDSLELQKSVERVLQQI